MQFYTVHVAICGSKNVTRLVKAASVGEAKAIFLEKLEKEEPKLFALFKESKNLAEVQAWESKL